MDLEHEHWCTAKYCHTALSRCKTRAQRLPALSQLGKQGWLAQSKSCFDGTVYSALPVFTQRCCRTLFHPIKHYRGRIETVCKLLHRQAQEPPAVRGSVSRVSCYCLETWCRTYCISWRKNHLLSAAVSRGWLVAVLRLS
jgi:hypothetical protein